MSILDKMRAKQPGGNTQVAPSHKSAKIIPIPRQSLPDAPGPLPATKADSKPLDPKPKAPKPKNPAPVAQEEVTASCGHLVKIKFTGEEDPKTSSRRKHHTSLPCPVCAAPIIAANREKRAAISKGIVEDKLRVNRRLPDKSRFEVEYDADNLMWSGKLILADGREFFGSTGGVFGLLPALERQLRENEAKRVTDDQIPEAAANPGPDSPR